ncbi:MAG TPA: rRNA maturation RNase YbeY [Candidatus Omnitrophota bacterium]|nr:rRNA maturation RNase YbeY [Candidatus Omnitrophota bacterium]
MKISVANLHPSYRVDAGLAGRIAWKVLRSVKKNTQGINIDLVFLDDRSIQNINKRFKNSDRPTDVLSFPLGSVRPGSGGMLGEIYISIDRAAEQSVIFNAELHSEFVRYIIHGILHLFGYDDITARDRARMSAKEDEILAWLSEKETLSKVLTRL